MLSSFRNVNHSKDRLYNNILDKLDEDGVGFTDLPQATTVLNTVTNVMWYLDPFRRKFTERRCHIPALFSPYVGYRDFKMQKKKEPVITAEELDIYSNNLGQLLLMPVWKDESFHTWKDNLAQLHDAMVKYHTILKEQLKRTTACQAALQPVRSMKENWAIESLPVSNTSTCKKLYNRLMESEEFQIVSIDAAEVLPAGRDKRKFIEALSFPFPVQLMTYYFGNYLGNVFFIWKACPRGEEFQQ